ncbi:MAG: glycosyltransferase, partial [Wenzhouxiangella sp.]
MKILYLQEEPPLVADQPASGNQIRAARLSDALNAAGCQIQAASRDAPQGFTRAGDIEALIAQHRPDILLCAYWKQLEWLRAQPGIPIVIDCYAPRPLEQLLADPAAADLFLKRYLQALTRADLFLVGNARQRRLLSGWLMTQGMNDACGDCLLELPYTPLQTTRHVRQPGTPLIVVSGGQDWPWRQARRWLAALNDARLAGRTELHGFEPGEAATKHVGAKPLMSWQGWQDFLLQEADVGLELADYNLEREHAQPFRVLDCLAAGVPVLVNPWLPLAREIQDYGAGWVIERPEQAVNVLADLAENASAVMKASAAAQRLMRERFDPETTTAPLVQWLQTPRRRSRASAAATDASTPKMSAPSPSLSGQLARAVLKPFCRRVDGPGVVVITRSDLFPTDHGAAVKIVETARALSRLGRPVGIVTAERGRWWSVVDGKIESRSLPAWLRWTAPPRALSHALHLARGLPASNAFLYWPLNDPWYGLRAAWVGRQIGASLMLAEFPAYAQSARLARVLNGGHAVLAEHNVEYERLAEQLPDLSPRQYEKLKNIELHLAGCMDAVVCVSDSDRRRLIADGLDPAMVSLIPHGVDLAGLRAGAGSAKREDFDLDPDRPILVFHGTFSYPPNRQALSLLAEELLPRLAARGQHCQLLAIGSQPPAGIDHPDIRLTGSLPSLTGALSLADLAVVPLISGGGTRMKILDYFAAGVPV